MNMKIARNAGRWAALLTALALAACGSRKDPPPRESPVAKTPGESAVAYANGHWFDGEKFAMGTRYVARDVFRAARPESVALTIDLGGGYVVPPYAEGHNHLLEGELIDTYIQHYLYRGVYYVKDQSGVPKVYRGHQEQARSPDQHRCQDRPAGLYRTGWASSADRRGKCRISGPCRRRGPRSRSTARR